MGLKSLMFGGINSLDYGVGITGAGVYSAPERDVEIIEVAGRNGAYIMDNGRFNNIEVIYNAGMGATTQEGFTKKLSDFRNAMLSQVGYQRLEDEYNPDEFRLGAYIGGLNVSPDANSMAGEFELRFNCKPQRYLKTGEDSIDITSGDKLINPTMFESHPLIAVTADDDGAVYVNDIPIIFQPDDFGDLPLNNNRPQGTSIGYSTFSYSAQAVWDESFYNTGDTIRAKDDLYIRIQVSTFPSIEGYNVGGISGTNLDIVSARPNQSNGTIEFVGKVEKSALTFKAGTKKAVPIRFYAIVEYKIDAGSATYGAELDFEGYVTYGEKSDGTIDYKSVAFEQNGTVEALESGRVLRIEYALETFPQLSVYSTKSAFTNEVFFDSETYEAYTHNDDGDKIYINNQVLAGSGFPTLKAGENGISFFGGIQTCRVIPRWWKI